MSAIVQSLSTTVVTQKLAAANLTVTGPLTNQKVSVSFSESSLIRVSALVAITPSKPATQTGSGDGATPPTPPVQSVVATITVTDPDTNATNVFTTSVSTEGQVGQGIGLFMATPETTINISLAPNGTDVFPAFAVVNINVEGL